MKTISYSEMNDDQKEQYINCVWIAFPDIINQSEIVQTCWEKVTTYFSEYQRIIFDQNAQLEGIICTLPFFWDKAIDQLPDDGWDWLIQKGISDYEHNVTPNFLGGLQIIVPKEKQGQGISKLLIAEGKRLKIEKGFQYFTIPIRPTYKHRFPEMAMTEYMQLKDHDKLYDPWIRTHLNNGAKIISVCKNSMNVKGDLNFWEKLAKQKITQSGLYKIEGALNLVTIDYEKNIGEYREDNIWIYYS